jgi:hypothetical protein
VRSRTRGTKTKPSKRRERIREARYNKEYERCVTEEIPVYKKEIK